MSLRNAYFDPEDAKILPKVIAATEYIIYVFEHSGTYPVPAQAAAHVLGQEYDPRSIPQRRSGVVIARVMGSIANKELEQGDHMAALQKMHQYEEMYTPHVDTN